MAEDQTTGVANDRPRTVAELMERIARERGALERAIAAMDDDALAASSGGWSVKDHLAHVAAWERRLIGELRGDPVAERLGLDEDAFATADTDTLNATIYSLHRGDPPAAARAEFLSSGETLRAAFADLSDADLMRPVRPDDPSVDTLVDLISWDTYKHYPDHAAAIAGRA